MNTFEKRVSLSQSQKQKHYSSYNSNLQISRPRKHFVSFYLIILNKKKSINKNGVLFSSVLLT